MDRDLTFIGPCIANIFSEYNQQDATFLKCIYFCKTLYMFQTVFLSIISSSKLHIQRQVFVRPIPLPAARQASSRQQYWSDKYLTLYVQFWAPDDGRKNRLKYVERLTEINKLWNVASCCTLRIYCETLHLVVLLLYSANKLWTESRFAARIYIPFFFFPFSGNKQQIIMNTLNLAGTKNSLILIRLYVYLWFTGVLENITLAVCNLEWTVKI